MEEGRSRDADLMHVEIKPLSSRTLKRLLRVADVRPPKSAVSPTSPLDEVVDESAPENGQLVQAVFRYSLLSQKVINYTLTITLSVEVN